MSLNSLDKRVQARILKALRLIWSQTFRAKALRASAVLEYPRNKDGTLSKRYRISGYICTQCGDRFQKDVVQVDHIVPVKAGKTLTERLDLLFCLPSGLQVLCKWCHQSKTNTQRRE